MDSPVLQVVPLGFQWPTIDPFLFCVHHLDHYPAGTPELGPPSDTLRGRNIGSDFEPRDGWRMYHGDVVPGFPQHPHRGFETVTFVRRGLIDHSDSLGAAARFGRGDVQWLTAGSGIVHSEMFPLLAPDGPNTLELFQIWVNLPSTDKLVDPYFSMLWEDEIPKVTLEDGAGGRTTVTVIAGAFGGTEPPSPPPNSWASRSEADLAIWHVSLEPGATFTLPPAAGEETVRTLYLFEGEGISIRNNSYSAPSGLLVQPTEELGISAENGAEILVLQGRPIGEPVAQSGPFVMNTRDEVMQAFEDYRRTGFGGWPWSQDGPTHGTDGARFARYPDGVRIDKVG